MQILNKRNLLIVVFGTAVTLAGMFLLSQNKNADPSDSTSSAAPPAMSASALQHARHSRGGRASEREEAVRMVVRNVQKLGEQDWDDAKFNAMMSTVTAEPFTAGLPKTPLDRFSLINRIHWDLYRLPGDPIEKESILAYLGSRFGGLSIDSMLKAAKKESSSIGRELVNDALIQNYGAYVGSVVLRQRLPLWPELKVEAIDPLSQEQAKALGLVRSRHFKKELYPLDLARLYALTGSIQRLSLDNDFHKDPGAGQERYKVANSIIEGFFSEERKDSTPEQGRKRVMRWMAQASPSYYVSAAAPDRYARELAACMLYWTREGVKASQAKYRGDDFEAARSSFEASVIASAFTKATRRVSNQSSESFGERFDSDVENALKSGVLSSYGYFSGHNEFTSAGQIRESKFIDRVVCKLSRADLSRALAELPSF